jgi:ParB family transcriptional regulator, chromosome partitioning protein
MPHLEKEEVKPTESKVTIDHATTSWYLLIKITPNRNQPRKIFKEKELLELAESIRENGVIQPLIVTENEMGSFDLVAGERRLKASKLAGLDRVPVVIKRATKKEHMVMSIIENVQRSDLNCIEEALAYFQLMNEFGLTQEEVAKKVGKERSTVANFLRILKLPKDVIMMLNKEMLTFGHAKVLAAIGDDETTKRVANEAVNKNLSVRELEEMVKTTSKKKMKADEGKNLNVERYTQLKDRLEKKTGFHFALKAKKNGAGQITIKFSNEAEFNDIFSYLMK